MNDEQTRIVKEIADNKELYLVMAGSKKAELEKLYEKFEPAFSQWYLDLLNELGSRYAYQASLKSPKIDPYIAGGAAQGVAGIGAGIYAAGSAAQRNQRIEADRAYYKDKVFSDTYAKNASEGQVLAIAAKIDAKLDSVARIRNHREAAKEKEYQTARQLMQSSLNTASIEKAKKMFFSLGSYKDSASLALACQNKKGGAKQGKVALISLVLSAIIALIGGLPAGPAPFFIIFAIAFFISYLVLQFTVK